MAENKELLENTTNNGNTETDTVPDLSDKLIISSDGKTVIGLTERIIDKEISVHIPSGIEIIEDNAFLYIQIDSLFLPKELKYLGKYTVKYPYGVKYIRNIEIEEGNEHFYLDDIGFYEVENGKKKLIFLMNRNINTYVAPSDVTSFEERSFYGCDKLKHIVLSENAEEFDEFSLPYYTDVKEIFIPKSVKYIRTRYGYDGIEEDYPDYDIDYRIDEENKYYFKDEDSIYKVLDGGTYKLIKYCYKGKGRVLILSGTSVIGENAFRGLNNIKKIRFPKSLKVIEECAFTESSISSITFQEGIQRIEQDVFSYCKNLKSVKLNPKMQYIDRYAFWDCEELNEIKATDNETKFFYNQSVFERSLPNEYRGCFDDFAKNIVETISKESIQKRYDKYEDIFNKAKYDAKKQVVSVRLPIIQESENSDLVKENESVKILIKGDWWEVKSFDGKSIGKIKSKITLRAIPYLNCISISDGTITKIIRNPNKKEDCDYPIVYVNFDITERQISYNLSEQDLITRTQFGYYIEDDEVHLVRWIGNGSAKTVTIPATVEGKPITTLCSNLFNRDIYVFDDDYKNYIDINNLRTIIIPEGVKRVESCAFANAKKLNKIIFPSSIEYIAPDVFGDTSSIDTSYDSLCISDYYKKNCLNIKNIFVAPAKSYAEKFLKEYKVDNIFLFVANDNSDETIEKVKFLWNFNIKSVDNGLSIKFDKECNCKESIVEIPATICEKPVVSFDLCDIPNNVKKLIIPASIKSLLSIGSNKVYFSSNLESVEIDPNHPDYYTDGKAIFSKDKKTLLRFVSCNTTEYVIPNGTEKIAEYGFYRSEFLEKVVLPKSIKYIAGDAFYGCEKLESIEGIEYADKLGKNFWRAEIPYLYKIPIVIEDSSLIRYNDKTKKIVKIPDGITTICKYAFKNNSSIEEIILPSSVRIIEEYAFYYDKFEKINIPDGVKEIRKNVFYDCMKLKRLYIPASVENIDISAFPISEYYDCDLESIELDPNNMNYCSVNGMLLSKDKTELIFAPNLIKGEIKIPDGVKVIKEKSFYSNMSITELTLSDSVTTIEDKAFFACLNLNTVNFSKNLKKIGDKAFSKCNIENVILPKKLEHIGAEAFAQNKIQKITLPKSVRTLGWGAFSCVPEIEIYDSIDPKAKDAYDGIDTINGHLNSPVGFIGIGKAKYSAWEYAVNHYRFNYTITVRSSETDEIKFKVWMGADTDQRDYYCFLSSAWGHNATFAFKKLDEFFPKIYGTANRLQVAKYRLEYPYDLSDEDKAKYKTFVKENT